VKSILVAVDFSNTMASAVGCAVSLADAASAKLWLLHVGPPEADMFGKQLVRKVVEGDVPPELREPHEKVDAVLARGTAVQSILEEARVRDVELIVLGSHGHGAFYRAIVGSVGEGVLRGSTRPVLIVPSPRRAA
jgi:nucleotide-binding universal stress UspA family protein